MHSRRRPGHRQPQYSAGTTIIIILLMAVLLYFTLAGAVGNLISDKIITPFLTSHNTTTGSATATNTATDTTAATPTPNVDAISPSTAETSVVTTNVNTQAIVLYAVQLGLFSQETNAEYAAQTNAAAGGAGYVLPEGDKFRILSSANLKETSATAAKEAYESTSGTQCYLYTFELPAISLKVISLEQQSVALQGAYDGWMQAMTAWDELLNQINSGTFTTSDMQTQLLTISSSLTQQQLQLQTAGAGTDSNILEGLLNVLQQTSLSLDKLGNDTYEDQKVFSQEMNEKFLSSFFLYRDYLTGITASAPTTST